MRVLYFDQHFGTPKGATGSRSYQFSRALLAAGHEVTMVCGDYGRAALPLARGRGKFLTRDVIDGIDVIALRLPYSNETRITTRMLVFLRFALRAVWIALTSRYDLVFASSTPLTVAMPGIAARIVRRRPFVFEVRDLWPELPRALGMRNPLLLGGMSLLEWAAYRSANACIGLSPGIVSGIKRRSAPGKPIAMIPNCSDLDLFVQGRREDLDVPGVQGADFVAAFAGAHGHANGLDVLVDAATVLQQRGVRNIKLVFVGDGKIKGHLISVAGSRGLDNCIFLPPIARIDLARLLGSVNCGLMILKNVPAFYYGTSPNKFFDYVSAGVPVLNNYPGWLADMIGEHRCGLVVRPDDPAELADGLQYLADHPGECKAMGQRARALAEERFSRSVLARQFVSFLEGYCRP